MNHMCPPLPQCKSVMNFVINVCTHTHTHTHTYAHTHSHTHTHTHMHTKCHQDTIVQHSLPLVSFSADLRRDKKETFTYIAKTSPKAKEYVCYAYEVPRGQVYNIYITVILYHTLYYEKSIA